MGCPLVCFVFIGLGIGFVLGFGLASHFKITLA